MESLNRERITHPLDQRSSEDSLDLQRISKNYEAVTELLISKGKIGIKITSEQHWVLPFLEISMQDNFLYSCFSIPAFQCNISITNQQEKLNSSELYSLTIKPVWSIFQSSFPSES